MNVSVIDLDKVKHHFGMRYMTLHGSMEQNTVCICCALAFEMQPNPLHCHFKCSQKPALSCIVHFKCSQ